MIAPSYGPIQTPLGPGYHAYNERGVVLVRVGSEARFLAEARRTLKEQPVRRDPPRGFASKIAKAMRSGDGSVVDWDSMGEFQRKVLQACAQIPYGSVRSYGDLARMIGAPRAARAVGTACARNPVPFVVPCHRVIRSGGELGGYGIGGTKAKERLLRAEGL